MRREERPTVRIRDVLAEPRFRWLWLAQATSHFGGAVTLFAVLVAINESTSSTSAVAGMAIASYALPPLLLGVVAGALVDRWDRRRVMMISDLLIGVTALGFLLVRRTEGVALYYVIGFVQGACRAFFEPARIALLGSVVEPAALMPANALSQTTTFVARVAGTAFAGFLVAAVGSDVAFVFEAATCLVSVLMLSFVTVPSRQRRARELPHGKRDSIVHDDRADHRREDERPTLRSAVAALLMFRSNRVILAVLLVEGVGSLAAGATSTLAIPYLVNVLHAHATTIGLVDAVEVLGMVVGSMLVARLVARFSRAQLVLYGVCSMAAWIVAIGAAPSVPLVLVPAFGAGVCSAPVQAAIATLAQGSVPDEMLGRVSSLRTSVGAFGLPISIGTAGVLGNLIGIRAVFYFIGLVMLVAGVYAGRLLSPVASPDPSRVSKP